MILPRPTGRFAGLPAMGALRWMLVSAVFAVIAVPEAADAARRPGIVRAGAFDGIWNVAFTTTRGNCSSTNSVPFAVSGTRVSSAGGGRVTGGISRSGNVSVRISVGASVASGSGRLAGYSGGGRWAGIISGERCSGVWQASRG